MCRISDQGLRRALNLIDPGDTLAIIFTYETEADFETRIRPLLTQGGVEEVVPKKKVLENTRECAPSEEKFFVKRIVVRSLSRPGFNEFSHSLSRKHLIDVHFTKETHESLTIRWKLPFTGSTESLCDTFVRMTLHGLEYDSVEEEPDSESDTELNPELEPRP